MAGNRNSYSKRNLILDILIVIAAIALVFLFLQMRKQDNMAANQNTQIARATEEAQSAVPEETVSAAEPQPEVKAAVSETQPETAPETTEETPAEEIKQAEEPDAAEDEAVEETASADDVTEKADAAASADPKPAAADADIAADVVEEVVVQTEDGEKVELQPATADAAPVVEVAAVELTPVPTEEPKSYGSLRVAVLGGMYSAFGTENSYYPDGEVIQESEMWWAAALERSPYEILSVVNSSAVGTAYSLDASAANAPWQEARVGELGSAGDPDLILIMVGEEDPAYGESGQAMASETEAALLQSPASTARGAALTFSRVTARWPEARVIVLIPPETVIGEAQREGMTLQRFNWAMNEVDDTARQMGIEVIDLRDCELSTDGIYPLLSDMVKMANLVSAQLTTDAEQ